LGYHPVAVVILHIHKYGIKVTREFKSGGLHERHVVVTWKLGNHPFVREYVKFRMIHSKVDEHRQKWITHLTE